MDTIDKVRHVNGVMRRVAEDLDIDMFNKTDISRSMIKYVFLDSDRRKAFHFVVNLDEYNPSECIYGLVCEAISNGYKGYDVQEINMNDLHPKGYYFDTGLIKRHINSVYGTLNSSNLYKREIDEMHETPNIWFKRSNFIMPINNHDVPKIEKVIFNDPATIIIWRDGTKTVVKADNESFDTEKGLAMAISKKALGNQGNYYETFKKWLPEANR